MRTILAARFRLALTMAILAMGVGCSGKTADLGSDRSGPGSSPAPARPSYSTPFLDAQGTSYPGATKLVDGELAIDAFTIDAGIAYWFVGSGLAGITLHSCVVSDCAGTLQSWADPRDSSVEVIRTDASTVYWLWGPISSCPKGDCSNPRQIVAPSDPIWNFIVDGPTLFAVALDGGLFGCQIADCARSWHAVPLVPPAAEGAASVASEQFLGELLGELRADGQYLYLVSNDLRIIRVREDGVGPFEVVARNQTSIRSLALAGDFIYWTESVPLGHIYSCPKSGCSGAPAVVTSGLSSPWRLAADDQDVYFSEPTVPDRISRSPTMGGASPSLLIDRVQNRHDLQVDDTNFYFDGFGACDVAAGEACGYLAAVAK